MSADPALLATAIEAVVRSGDMQMARFGVADVRIEKKGAIDLVTEVDFAVERMFRTLIAERFPDHDVLAEELDATATGARHRWVFDPLDGTTNFAHGVPIFCASLALEIDGEAEVAAVYDPNRRELFTGERGVGAWLNGRPIRTSAATKVLDSILVTGFPYTVHEQPEHLLRVFGRMLQHARAVRRLGSAAIDLCWVAAGRMEAFWEEHLSPWDTRAGALIVEEAGGRVTGMDGGHWKPSEGHILASNAHVHDEILSILRQT